MKNIIQNFFLFFITILPNLTFAQLDCNVETKIVAPSFSSSIVSQRTGFTGVVLGSISNASNVINNNTDDYASINITAAVAATATLSVASGQKFDAGHLAGFEISSTNLLNVNLLGGISIRTYLNGVEQETSNANNLLLNLGVLGSMSRGVIGFITTKPFDEVQFRVSTLLDVNLVGSIQIHNMIVKKLCLGPVPACNVDTRIVAPAYPAVVQQICIRYFKSCKIACIKLLTTCHR